MKLIILGAGGYGDTIADIVEQQPWRYDDFDFLDDSKKSADDPLVVGRCSDFDGFTNEETDFYPAFGDNKLRLSWIEKLQAKGARLVMLVHPSAYISPASVVGTGTVILPKAAIGTNTEIERGVIINQYGSNY